MEALRNAYTVCYVTGLQNNKAKNFDLSGRFGLKTTIHSVSDNSFFSVTPNST